MSKIIMLVCCIALQLTFVVKEAYFCQNKEVTGKHGVILIPPRQNNCSWYIKPGNNTVTTIFVKELTDDTIAISYDASYRELRYVDKEVIQNDGIIWIKPKYPVTDVRVLFSIRDESVCQGFDLACADGTGCYNIEEVCNDQFVCEDHSDESYCSKCADGEVPCDTTSDYCFSLTTERCDGVINCPDGEDELNCYPKCHGRIQCANGIGCFDQEQLCDGRSSCLDGTDENNCMQFCRNSNSTTNYIWCDKKCVNSHSYESVCGGDVTQIATNAIRFIIFSVISLTICFVTLTCRSYLCRRDVNHLIADLPEFPLPPFQGPGESIHLGLSDSDFLHGGEIYEAFVRSRHNLRYDD